MVWKFEKVNIPAQGTNAVLTVEPGSVTITDIGSKKIAGLPSQSWGLLINYKTQSWVFGYEGEGEIGLDFDLGGNLKITGNGTVTPINYSK
jgi:hypothetical protein